MMPSFAELWEQFQIEQRARKALDSATTEAIKAVWDSWDGMAVMTVAGVYIPDSWIVEELKKRGVDCGM